MNSLPRKTGCASRHFRLCYLKANKVCKKRRDKEIARRTPVERSSNRNRMIVVTDQWMCAGVERLREQDPRSLLRDRLDSSSGDRRQQAARGDLLRRVAYRTVQTRVSVNLRLGNTRPPPGGRIMQPRQHTERKRDVILPPVRIGCCSYFVASVVERRQPTQVLI